VKVNGKNVNQSLLEAGYAWHYRKYCKESFCYDWIKLEQEAINSKQGLWADPQAIAPGDWRKGFKNSKTPSQTAKIYTASASQGVYHGNVKSNVFHDSGCRHYECKNCVKSFGSRLEAVNSGYRACGICRP
jgi:intein-encoded DNA endonuclease-like protein